MEFSLEKAVFIILATVIIVFSVLTVTTKRVLRAATYLLFVLFATAAIYFQLNYSFLGAVQLTIYAGGIIVLYVFSILLTSADKDDKIARKKSYAGAISALTGAGICIFIMLTHTFTRPYSIPGEIQQKVIGYALMGTDKYQYLLPFEAISVLLLTCVVAGIIIARKR